MSLVFPSITKILIQSRYLYLTYLTEHIQIILNNSSKWLMLKSLPLQTQIHKISKKIKDKVYIPTKSNCISTFYIYRERKDLVSLWLVCFGCLFFWQCKSISFLGVHWWHPMFYNVHSIHVCTCVHARVDRYLLYNMLSCWKW